MTKCVYKNCKNNASFAFKKDGISYFSFPRDPVRCGEWVAIVSRQRREEWFKPTISSVICSKHFAESDIYVTENGKKQLQNTAVPQIAIEFLEDFADTATLATTSETENEENVTQPLSKTINTTLRKIYLKKQKKIRTRLNFNEKLIESLKIENKGLHVKNEAIKRKLKETEELQNITVSKDHADTVKKNGDGDEKTVTKPSCKTMLNENYLKKLQKLRHKLFLKQKFITNLRIQNYKKVIKKVLLQCELRKKIMELENAREKALRNFLLKSNAIQ